MTNYKLAILSSLFFCSSALANSMDFTSSNLPSETELDIGFSLDILKGKANQYLYNKVSKFEQLNLKINSAPITKLHANWTPLNYLTVGIDGWTTFGIKGDGKMDNYYWMDLNDPSRLTHSSNHPDTDLTYANQLNMQLTGWIYNEPQVALGGIIGYQLTDFKWEAYGGYYSYQNPPWVDSNVLTLTYRQKYRLPYIGLSSRFRLNNFEVDMLYKYSKWIRAQDVDTIHLENHTFSSRGYDATYNGAKLTFGYYIQPTVKIYIDSEWDHYSEGKGWTKIQKNISKESRIHHGEAAGLKNSNYQFGLGVKGLF